MASEELLVTVGMSATKFKTEIKKVNDDLKTAEKNFKTTEKTANLMEKSAESLGTKLKALSNVFEAQNTKISSYKNRLEELSSSNKELEQRQTSLQGKLQTLNEKFDKAAAEMGENSTEAKQLQKEINSLEKEISKNEKALQRGTAEFDRLGNELNSTQLEADYTRAKMDSLQREIDEIETGAAVSEMNSLDQSMEKAADEAKTLQTRLTEVGDKFKNFGNSLKGLGQNLTTRLTLPIVGAGTAMVAVASDAGEMQSKFDTVFKTTAADVEAWAKSLGASIGRSSLDLKEAVSNSADLMIGMGMTEQKAGELSQKFIELAYDLGSFNNVSDSKALEAMTKAMMGETEMAKSLGINLSVATMEQSEYVKALGKKWSAMTQAEKAEAYYAEAVKQSTNAIGDAARTSDSLTNRTRALQGKIKDLSAEFGEKLLPVALKVVNGVIKVLDIFTSLDDRTQTIILIVGGLIAIFGPLLMMIGQVSIGIGALTTMFGALTAISTPVLVAIGAIALIFAGLAIGIKSNSEEMKAALQNLSDKFQEAKAIIEPAIQGLWQTFQDIWETVGVPVFNAISELTAILVNTFAELFPIAAEIFTTMCDAFNVIWETVLKPVFTFLMEIVNDVIELVREKMPMFVEIFQGAWDSIKNLWETVLKPIFDIISPIIGAMIEAIRPLWNSFKTLISAAFDAVHSVWTNVLKPVFDTLVSVVGWVIDKVKPHMDTFSSVITGAMNSVLTPIQWVIDKFSDLFGWIGKAADKVGGFLDKINPFKSIEGPEIQARFTMPENALQTMDLNHEVYTARTPFSQDVTSTLGPTRNSMNSYIGSLNKVADSVKSNIDIEALGSTIVNAIINGLKDMTLQANVEATLDGEKLSSKLNEIDGRNLNLYGRFNGV